MVVSPATANELEKSIVHESHLYAKPSDMSVVEKIVIHHTPHERKRTTCLRLTPQTLNGWGAMQFSEFFLGKCDHLYALSTTHQGFLAPRISGDNRLIVNERQLSEVNRWELIHFAQEQITSDFPNHPWRFPKVLENELPTEIKRHDLIGRVDNLCSGAEWNPCVPGRVDSMTRTGTAARSSLGRATLLGRSTLRNEPSQVLRLTGDIEVAAVDRHHAQPAIEGLRAGGVTGQRRAGDLLQVLEEWPRQP